MKNDTVKRAPFAYWEFQFSRYSDEDAADFIDILLEFGLQHK